MTDLGPWPYDDLRAALDVDCADGAVDAVDAARWLAEHPEGVLTAEDFVSRPSSLPPLSEIPDDDRPNPDRR